MTSLSAGLRAVSEATLACQAGSLAAFAIMVLRQSFVIDTSAPVESTNASWHITHRPEPTKSSVVKSLSAIEAAAGGTGVGVPCICASCVAMTSGVRIKASCVAMRLRGLHLRFVRCMRRGIGHHGFVRGLGRVGR